MRTASRFPGFLVLLLAVCPAPAAILYTPNPPAVTAGAATVTLDIVRTSTAGEGGGFSDDEMDTFEWFAPNVSILSGQSVKLPLATFVRSDLIRLQIPAERLTVPGIATIVYTVDPSGRRERQTIVLFVNRPPQIEGILTGGAVNTRMARTLEAVNGTGPFRWSLASGSLPPGVALVGRAQSADFVGVPTAAGAYTFTVRVVDGFNLSAEKQYTTTIVGPPALPLRISTASLPSGVAGLPYQAVLQATGGTAPVQWSSLGDLPPGLSISAAGVLGGTPTVAESYRVIVRAADANSFDQKTFLLVIDPGFTSFNAASFEFGVSAPQAIVSAYGTNLAPSLGVAPGPNLPTSIMGISVVIRDSTGREAPAPLFFVSQRQINYLVPELAAGPATVSLRSGARAGISGTLEIRPVAPGIFTANADGKGVAAGFYIRPGAGRPEPPSPLSRCAAPGSCRPESIDLGSDGVFLTLFATGLRGRNLLSPVTVTVGGAAVPVLYAGTQNEYPGLDQINVVLPPSLAGRGTVTVQVEVDGREANPVTIAIR